MAHTVVVGAAPRIVWGASLILMLVSTFTCPGGMICGSVNPERVLSGHYVCMSLAWPVCRLPPPARPSQTILDITLNRCMPRVGPDD